MSLLVARVVFFFSSRRRHTRCSRDWSSDVCSSDLRRRGHGDGEERLARAGGADAGGDRAVAGAVDVALLVEIGRASGRGRGEISGVAVSLKKKKRRDRTSVNQSVKEAAVTRNTRSS